MCRKIRGVEERVRLRHVVQEDEVHHVGQDEDRHVAQGEVHHVGQDEVHHVGRHASVSRLLYDGSEGLHSIGAGNRAVNQRNDEEPLTVSHNANRRRNNVNGTSDHHRDANNSLDNREYPHQHRERNIYPTRVLPPILVVQGTRSVVVREL
jgi:hypothetical protein